MTDHEILNKQDQQASAAVTTTESISPGIMMSLEDAYRELNGSPSSLHGPERDEAQHLAIKTLSATSNVPFEASLLLAKQCFHGRSDDLRLAALEGLALKEPTLAIEVATAIAFRDFQESRYSRGALLLLQDSAPERVIGTCLEQFNDTVSSINALEAGRILAHLAEHSSNGTYEPFARYAATQLQASSLDAIAEVGTRLLERLGDGHIATETERSHVQQISEASAMFQELFKLDITADPSAALQALKESAPPSLTLIALAAVSEHQSPELRTFVMDELVALHPEPGTPSGLTRRLVALNADSNDATLSDRAMDHQIENLW